MDRRKWCAPEKLKLLIFGLDIQRKTLSVFSSKEQILEMVEGLSIAEGDWRFFSSDGSALEARFSVPAKIDFQTNTYSNGEYTLEAAPAEPILLSFLQTVACEDKAHSGLLTLQDVEQFLVDQTLDRAT